MVYTIKRALSYRQGLAYIAAYLRRSGKYGVNIGVNIIDMNARSIELKDIPWRDWDIVGISGDTSRHNAVLEIAAHAKYAGRIVVVGGYHATFMDEDTLRTGNVDYVVRGEGEEIFAELLEALTEGGDVSKVKGISYLDSDGNLVRTPDALPVQQLNDLPMPARDHRLCVNINHRKRATAYYYGQQPRLPIPLHLLLIIGVCRHKWRGCSPQNIADEIENVLIHTATKL